MTNHAETLLDALAQRRSIRRYLEKPVPREVLIQLVEAASFAPSAGNRQDWFFSIVTDRELLRELARKARKAWDRIIEANQDLAMIDEIKIYSAAFGNLSHAPALIAVAAARPNMLQQHLLGDMAGRVAGSTASAAMAAQNLMLAADAHGLGTCCMTGALAADREMAQLLELTRKQQLVCLITVGYPDEAPSPPARKPAEQITRFY